jgi:glycosyltransferase involved in cell wall biosynthesis
LTVILPCKNERLNIRPCIESVKSIADEVLVADSGSTDGTVDIARQIGGCRIIQREYVHSGDFKNWAIPQAAHPWVLIVDADERVTESLAAEIQQILETGPEYDGYWIYRQSYLCGHRVRYSGWSSDRVLRLFRRDISRYEGDNDHAEVSVSTGKVGRLRTKLLHFTYWSYDQYLQKINRYSTYQARVWHAKGKRPRFARMLLAVPFRFLHLYLVRWGFLDGWVGIQVCSMTAFYSFLKQARLWELHHAKPQPDLEADRAAGGFDGACEAATAPRPSRVA